MLNKKKKKIVTVIISLLVILCSCSKTKPVSSGSFSFECPNSLDLKEIEITQNDLSREVHFFVCPASKEYERDYLFKGNYDAVFDITLMLSSSAESVNIEECVNVLKADLLKHSVWTVFSEIENTTDSITFKSSPNRKDIQDYGICYYRYFRKENGVAAIEIRVREDGNEEYENAIRQILKSIK